MAYTRFGVVSIEEVLSNVAPLDATSDYMSFYHGKYVDMRSLRYHTFLKSISCVRCGLEGAYFAVEQGQGTNKPDRAHLNLYAVLDGKEVLMTKDHIIPRSKGGTDALDNLQTMCQPCNTKKGSTT